MNKNRIIALSIAAFTLTAPLVGVAVAAPVPPKTFDQKNAKEHLSKHQKYPATKAELVASCENLVDFSAEDKKWFSATLPDKTYKSAAEVTAALGLK